MKFAIILLSSICFNSFFLSQTKLEDFSMVVGKGSFGQDLMKINIPNLTKNDSLRVLDMYKHTGNKNIYKIFSNYPGDSTAFDFIFKKNKFLIKNNPKINVILLNINDGSEVYNSGPLPIQYFNYIFYSNVPSCQDCFVIRIRLPYSTFQWLYEEEIICKLIIKDSSTGSNIYNNLKYQFEIKQDND
jgi:hypothetical protein